MFFGRWTRTSLNRYRVVRMEAAEQPSAVFTLENSHRKTAYPPSDPPSQKRTSFSELDWDGVSIWLAGRGTFSRPRGLACWCCRMLTQMFGPISQIPMRSTYQSDITPPYG